MNWKSALAVIVVFFGYQVLKPAKPVYTSPGVTVKMIPFQGSLDPGTEKPFMRAGQTITPLAKYRIEARVLGIEKYSFDRGAEISPLDFALGWGAMSDSAIIDKLEISQGNRFYRYQWTDQSPVDLELIIVSSANTHLIPRDAVIQSELEKVLPGMIVQLEGLLVRVDAPDGGKWVSSLTRADSGGGACELLYVTGVKTRLVTPGVRMLASP